MSTTETELDVLVVGAGPVGLTAACQLLQHGVTSLRIIDKAEAQTIDYSKAIGVWIRTLEVFEDMDIATDMIQSGVKVQGISLWYNNKHVYRTPTKLAQVHDVRYPFLLSLTQANTERILTQHLQKLGVEVERPVELTSIEQDDDGVTATLFYRDSGREEVVRAKWLLGCDGAHSKVRKLLNIPFEGSTYKNFWCVVDVYIDKLDRPHDEVLLLSSESATLVAFPLPEEKMYRVTVVEHLSANATDGEALKELSPEQLQHLLRQVHPQAILINQIPKGNKFRLSRRLVSHYRDRRVFLAGDAAHLHSPVGGQGLNTGIQDALNIGWKLALVVRNACVPAILDTYDIERRPVAAQIVKWTHSLTRLIAIKKPMMHAVRNKLMGFLMSFEVMQQKMIGRLSGLQISYRCSLKQNILLAEHHDHSHSDFRSRGPRPGDRAPDVQFFGETRLFDVTGTNTHHLLLFCGFATKLENYLNLERIALQVRYRYENLFSIHMVVPGDCLVDSLEWDGSVLVDKDNRLHERYGASHECLYLIRPDRYVAYRSQPSDGDKLLQYLKSIFVEPSKRSNCTVVKSMESKQPELDVNRTTKTQGLVAASSL